MLAWKRQGAAFAADLALLDGRQAKVIVVAGRENPKGVALLQPSPDGTTQVLLPVTEFASVPAGDYIEILLLQERVFGNSDLPAPEVPV